MRRDRRAPAHQLADAGVGPGGTCRGLPQLLAQAGLLAEGASLYDAANISLMHHVYAALRANHLYHRDQHYVNQGGEIVIVDEFTGRLMTGRRWSEGLHQAVEAKEGVQIQSENQTLASITFQNFFRMYGKLAGMTGTADTEAYEFHQIYGLETVVVPTTRPMIRKDQNDKVYRTMKEKHDAIIADIKDCVERGQPVLVGTTSIESSELLSNFLKQEKLAHEVLNAKQHAREADIVAQAGRAGAITIATNMAGRGTDIVLGGSIASELKALAADDSLSEAECASRTAALKAEWQQRHDAVLAAGGLHIIGTERHESRRIDNQLRGRAGRQGDPGSSRFFLSLEDDLMRIFAGDRVKNLMERMGMPDDEPIEHPWVTKSVENAQKKVEERNFDIRKNLLEYDEVMDEQRKRVYNFRQSLLEGDSAKDALLKMIDEQIDALEIMGVNSASYLILPKIVATVLFFPFLTILSILIGIAGGVLVSLRKTRGQPATREAATRPRSGRGARGCGRWPRCRSATAHRRRSPASRPGGRPANRSAAPHSWA